MPLNQDEIAIIGGSDMRINIQSDIITFNRTTHEFKKVFEGNDTNNKFWFNENSTANVYKNNIICLSTTPKNHCLLKYTKGDESVKLVYV